MGEQRAAVAWPTAITSPPPGLGEGVLRLSTWMILKGRKRVVGEGREEEDDQDLQIILSLHSWRSKTRVTAVPALKTSRCACEARYQTRRPEVHITQGARPEDAVSVASPLSFQWAERK